MPKRRNIMLFRSSRAPRSVGLVLLTGLMITMGLWLIFGWPSESAHAAHNLAMHHAMQGSAGDAHGFTDGWLNGQTVRFFYTRDFFCEPPPTSGAPSQCEVGEDGEEDPRPGPIPTLYVMTPLGFRPDSSTLQCRAIRAKTKWCHDVKSRDRSRTRILFAILAHFTLTWSTAGWWRFAEKISGVEEPYRLAVQPAICETVSVSSRSLHSMMHSQVVCSVGRFGRPPEDQPQPHSNH